MAGAIADQKPQPSQAAGTAPTGTPPTSNGASSGDLKVGTYNLAGGNGTHGGEAKANEVTWAVARQVTAGGVDVLAAQEVDVGFEEERQSGRPEGYDYNEEVLKDTFVAEAKPEWQDESVSVAKSQSGNTTSYTATYSVEGLGTVTETVTVTTSCGTDGEAQYTATSQDGAALGSMSIAKDSYHEDGTPYLDGNGDVAYDPSVDTPITAYSARGGDDGDGTDATTTGNSVLLGPDVTLEKAGETGALNVERINLSNDPDKGKENRLAVAVAIVDADGQKAMVASTHLTDGGDDAHSDTRNNQYGALADKANAYEQQGYKVVLLGDLNSDQDHHLEAIGGLTTPDDADDEGTNAGHDHLYTDAAAASQATEVVPGGEQGPSDHPFKVWILDL